jgi:acetylornithine deacetylase/succinyl-diaminopimelate desuccinylase family protein
MITGGAGGRPLSEFGWMSMLTDTEKSILGEIAPEKLYALTAELVRRPSVSGEERPVADLIANFLGDHGFDAEMTEVEPGRPNVSACWGAEGPALLLTGHSDTVPVGEGWSRDPFGAEIADGRLYGRGSCDMKAGLAGMLLAMAAVKRRLPRPARQVIFAACVDEEEGGKGTQDALRKGLAAEWAVIGEPTELQPIGAAKGNAYFEVKVRGRSAHAGSPELGANAIYGAAKAIEAVQRHHAELRTRSHPLLGTPSASVGTVSGGFTVSAVPDSCTFWIDRRLIPGEDGNSALAELSRRLHEDGAAYPGTRIEERLAMEMPAMQSPPDHPIFAALAAAAADAGGPSLPLGAWSAACDGGFLQRGGIAPVVLFGPGSIVRQAHRPDEFVPLSETLTAARTYALLTARWLSAAADR